MRTSVRYNHEPPRYDKPVNFLVTVKTAATDTNSYLMTKEKADK